MRIDSYIPHDANLYCKRGEGRLSLTHLNTLYAILTYYTQSDRIIPTKYWAITIRSCIHKKVWSQENDPYPYPYSLINVRRLSYIS